MLSTFQRPESVWRDCSGRNFSYPRPNLTDRTIRRRLISNKLLEIEEIDALLREYHYALHVDTIEMKTTKNTFFGSGDSRKSKVRIDWTSCYEVYSMKSHTGGQERSLLPKIFLGWIPANVFFHPLKFLNCQVAFGGAHWPSNANQQRKPVNSAK